jgi:choline dehydrogenase-like flavoprotein
MKATVFDAIVVGSGAGGAAAAFGLSQAGAKVLVLEAGPSYDPLKDYKLSSDNWENEGFPYKPGSQVRYTVAALQALDKQHSTLRSWNHKTKLVHSEKNRQSQGYEHLQAVGGSTLRYTGEAHRLNPRAMKLASEHGAGADWPITYPDLEPYYLSAEKLIGVAGASDDQIRPRSAPYPLPPHAMSYVSQILGRGFQKLNLSWTANSLAALSQPYDGRPPCNQCGQCALGCSRLDKGTADLTFIAKALATGNCEVRSECRATEIVADDKDTITAVHYADRQGNQHKVTATTYLLAAGAVETPRLLLNSKSINNDDGQIGKHFLETLAWNSSALHPQNIASHRGHPSDAICWDFNAPDAINDVIGGCRFSLGVAESGLAGPAAYANRVVGGWGAGQKRKVREQFGHVISVGGIGESLPHEKSFIDLDPEVKDHLGLPVARIHSHLDDMAINRIRFMATKSRELLQAAGAGQPFEEYGTYDLFHSTHVFGGCRMGEDASSSVVNSDQQSHRYNNLYVVDASVFPSTGGGESPSLTISALALRAVAKLLASRS